MTWGSDLREVKMSRLAPEPTQHVYWVLGAVSPGCEADPSLPSSAKVENERHCTSTSPTCLHEMCWDYCAFTFYM
jgi:hypothetical protein